MPGIVLNSTSGPDGKLRLEVPVGRPNTEFEVEVVVRPKRQESKEWPPGYFDLFGSIDDPTFVHRKVTAPAGGCGMTYDNIHHKVARVARLNQHRTNI